MAKSVRHILLALTVLCCAVAAGCVSVQDRTPEIPSRAHNVPSVPGVYHTVARGETLWRISRMYGVDIDSISDANAISDVSQLESGRKLFIPGASKQAPGFAAVPGEDFVWPVKGSVVRDFGHLRAGFANKGLDIRPHGGADILASRSGTVVFYSEDFLDIGKTVILDHGDGFFTVYGGAGGVCVKPGDVVSRGSRIAYAPEQGVPALVHFQIRKGASCKNPSFYLPKS